MRINDPGIEVTGIELQDATVCVGRILVIVRFGVQLGKVSKSDEVIGLPPKHAPYKRNCLLETRLGRKALGQQHDGTKIARRAFQNGAKPFLGALKSPFINVQFCGHGQRQQIVRMRLQVSFDDKARVCGAAVLTGYGRIVELPNSKA